MRKHPSDDLIEAARQTQPLGLDVYPYTASSTVLDARRIAKERGLSIVFVNIWAAAGGYDMTNQVISDIESQHE